MLVYYTFVSFLYFNMLLHAKCYVISLNCCFDSLFLGGLQTKYKGASEACSFGGFDLIIADLLEGFLLPNVSFPPTNIHSWNVY